MVLDKVRLYSTLLSSTLPCPLFADLSGISLVEEAE